MELRTNSTSTAYQYKNMYHLRRLTLVWLYKLLINSAKAYQNTKSA